MQSSGTSDFFLENLKGVINASFNFFSFEYWWETVLRHHQWDTTVSPEVISKQAATLMREHENFLRSALGTSSVHGTASEEEEEEEDVSFHMDGHRRGDRSQPPRLDHMSDVYRESQLPSRLSPIHMMGEDRGNLASPVRRDRVPRNSMSFRSHTEPRQHPRTRPFDEHDYERSPGSSSEPLRRRQPDASSMSGLSNVEERLVEALERVVDRVDGRQDMERRQNRLDSMKDLPRFDDRTDSYEWGEILRARARNAGLLFDELCQLLRSKTELRVHRWLIDYESRRDIDNDRLIDAFETRFAQTTKEELTRKYENFAWREGTFRDAAAKLEDLDGLLDVRGVRLRTPYDVRLRQLVGEDKLHELSRFRPEHPNLDSDVFVSLVCQYFPGRKEKSSASQPSSRGYSSSSGRRSSRRSRHNRSNQRHSSERRSDPRRSSNSSSSRSPLQRHIAEKTDIECYECGERGHIRRFCPTLREQANLILVEDEKEDNSDDEQPVTMNTFGSSVWRENVQVNGQEVEAILDTGGSSSAISRKLAETLFPESIREARIAIKPFASPVVWSSGEALDVPVVVKGRHAQVRFLVMDDEETPTIIGFPDISGGADIDFEDVELYTYDEQSVAVPAALVDPFEIELDDPTPISMKVRNIKLKDREEVQRQISELLKAGIIVQSNSPWAFPIVVVHQKGKVRMCLDVRRLNERTIKDPYPVPLVSELLAYIREKKVFTQLDFKKGYWQVPLSEQASRVCTMITPWGKFSFKRMIFGLCNAPSKFQRVLDDIFGDIPQWKVLRFFDDLLIMGNSDEEVQELEEEVFRRCERFQLTVNYAKSKFKVRSVTFLSYFIEDGIISIPKDRITELTQLALPTDVSTLRSLLGMVEYYRPLIPRLSMIAKPLFTLLNKGAVFELGPSQVAAIGEIKNAIQSARTDTVMRPEEGWSFVLITDASNIGVGATLEQRKPGEPIRIIGFFSKGLNSAQRNYSTSERELLAIILALRHFEFLVGGYHITVLTDHRPLTDLLKTKDPRGRMQRWVWTLQEFDLTLDYIQGKINFTADFLSRACPAREGVVDLPINAFEETEWRVLQEQDNFLRAIVAFLRTRQLPDNAAERGRVKQSAKFMRVDEEGILRLSSRNAIVVPESLTKEVLTWAHEGHASKAVMNERLKDLHLPRGSKLIDDFVKKCGCEQRSKRTEVASILEDSEREGKDEEPVEEVAVDPSHVPRLQPIWEAYIKKLQAEDRIVGDAVFEGINYKLANGHAMIILPDRAVSSVVRLQHQTLDSGHLGEKKTLARLKDFYFPNKVERVKNIIRSCEICQRARARPSSSHTVSQHSLVSRPGEIVSIDFVGPMTETPSGNVYIVTIVDHFSNWIELSPSNEASAPTALSALIQWVSRMGTPDVILSDRGRAFTGKLIEQFREVMEIEGRFTSPYHPQANGRNERMNRVLKEIIRKVLGKETDWDVLLPWVTMAYNSSRHSTKGLSPFFILHGYEMPKPSNISVERRQTVDAYIEDIQQRAPALQKAVMKAMQRSSEEVVTPEPTSFEVGEQVFFYDPSFQNSVPKFGISWGGPATILAKMSDVTYKLDIPTSHGRSNILHVDNLRSYLPSSDEDCVPSSSSVSATSESLEARGPRSTRQSRTSTGDSLSL